MDIRVKDWSTEADKTSLGRTYQSLYASAMRFALALVTVWLCLYVIQLVFPYVQNGAAAVGRVKFEMAQSPNLFKPKGHFRSFSFGNSKMLAGFHPMTFDSNLGEGTSSFNLAIPGDERFVDLLDSALVAGNVPTHVLVQAFPHTSQNRSSLLSVVQDNKKMVNSLFPFRNYVRDAFLFAFEAGSLASLVPHYKSNAAQIENLRRDRGYYFIKSQSHFPGDKLPDDFSLPTDRPNDALMRPFDVRDPEFLRLLHLAERYNFQIFLVPVAYRKGEYAPPPAENREMVDALRPFDRVHVVGPAYWLYDPSAFSDPVHLNTRGAIRYTTDLVEIIRRAKDEGP